MKKKFSLKKLAQVLFVLYAFYTLLPYFTWNTFLNGILGEAFGMQYSTGFAMLAILITFTIYVKGRIKPSYSLFIAVIIPLFTICFSGGIGHVLSFEWIPYLTIISFITIPKDDQNCVYRLYKRIIVLSLIVPIIIYLLGVINIELPYARLESYEPIKQAGGTYYKLYYFAVNRVSRSLSDFGVRKLCGVFDEPGRVGTICGLLLASDKLRIKNKWDNIILLIAGILSFSLSFYLIVAIYLFAANVQRLKAKSIAIIIVLAVSYLFFINFHFSNPDIVAFQQRFLVTGNGLVGDNRTNIYYDAIIKDFLDSGFLKVLFGNGAGSMSSTQSRLLVDGYSYKNLLYDYGFVGFGVQIIWLLVFTCENFLRKKEIKHEKYHILALLIVYLANMYQRPSMMSFQFLLIFIGGLNASYAQESTNKLPVIKIPSRRLVHGKSKA